MDKVTNLHFRLYFLLYYYTVTILHFCISSTFLLPLLRNIFKQKWWPLLDVLKTTLAHVYSDFECAGIFDHQPKTSKEEMCTCLSKSLKS